MSNACAKSKFKARMFKYLLTDGEHDIIAIESEPLTFLKIDKALPGTKIRLTGPIEIRRGIWLLQPHNV